jgi:hypothetical protein
MDLTELIKKLKDEFHFKSVMIKMGYSLYKSELYDLSFDFGASNGDAYYYVYIGNSVVMREDLPVFSRETEESIVYNKIYTTIRNIVRQQKIEKLL